MLDAEQKSKYNGAGIFADFAVVEVDFAKLLDKGKYSYSVWSASNDITNQYETEQNKLISKITNNYSESDKKVKFFSDSLLNEQTYAKFDRPLDFDPKKEDELKKI